MAASRPNIIIIMTDQCRADLSAREGYPLDTTPCLDRLAARGTWFNRAYTAMPACVCARISMLTASSATHVRTNYNDADVRLHRPISPLPPASAVYRTALRKIIRI